MSAEDRFEQIDHSLELEESLHVHAAERVAQRVAGLLIVVIVAAALLGLFGDGRLAKATVEGESTTLRYDWILRSSKETVLEFDIAPGDAHVSIPIAYFNDFKLDRVVPEPVDTQIAHGDARFIFTTTSTATLRFHFIPSRAGASKTRLQVNGDTFSIRQRVLP